MNKKLLLVLLLLLAGCSAEIVEPAESAVAETTVISEAVQEGEIITISVSEFKQMLENKESFLFYNGYAGCPYCAEAKPILEELVKERGSIYYIDLMATDFDFDSYVEEFSTDIFEVDDDGGRVIQSPTAVAVNQGQMVKAIIGVGTLEGYSTLMDLVEADIDEIQANQQDQQSTKLADMSGYGITGVHHFVESNAKEVVDKLNNGESFIVLFGFDTCPNCLEAVPVLNEVSKDYDYNILYVNTRANGESSNIEIPNYDLLVEAIGDYFATDEDGTPHLYVPFVMFVKDGVPKGGILGGDEDLDALRQNYITGFELMK